MNESNDVVFINPYPEEAYGINEATIEPPLGIGYLAAIVEKNDVKCSIIDANILQLKIDDILKQLKDKNPKIVGISVNLYSLQVSLKLTEAIKKQMHEVVVIWGGPTPTSSPEKIMQDSSADAICIGESEETIDEIIKNYKRQKHLFKDTAGVIYRDTKSIIKNPERMFIKDIDSIPFPAYHLFPDLRLYKSRSIKKPVAPLLTSRGCPFQCVYCSKDVFKNVCRMRSPENVIAEIDMLVKRYGVKQIDILDDNFTINKARTEKILDLLIDRNYDLHINLQTGIRTESIDQNIIDKMKKAKIFKIPFGVESGDPAILQKIRKHLDLNRVLHVAKMAKRAGMKVYGFFMIGLPGDTAESMQKTIDFAIKMDPNVANFCITIPFPGTPLYDLVKKEGHFLIHMDDGVNAGFYANQVFYELEGMDREFVRKYYKKAMREFYLRPKKMVELAFGIRSWSEFIWLFNAAASILGVVSENLG
jgi:radical SAM superfamily enzyme YgiQ (UPF0313 family)